MTVPIAIITSWPPSLNGIADYSNKLYLAISDLSPQLQLVILAEKLKSSNHEEDSTKHKNIHVRRVWSSDTLLMDLFNVIKEILKSNARIVHVQYEYWLYGRGTRALVLPLLILYLKLIRRKIVVTLHGIISITSFESGSVLRYHKINMPLRLAKYASLLYIKLLSFLSDQIIVHLHIMRKVLEEQYRINGKKICVIPHGIDNVNVVNSNPKVRIFLVFGHIRPDKGIENIIRAFAKVAQKANMNNIRLIIAGQYDENLSPESKGYIYKLIKYIKYLGLDKKILIHLNVSQEKINELYTDAYAIVLNYLDKDVLAASGPLSLAIAYTKPIIAAKIPRFLEFKDYVIFVESGDTEELADIMKSLIEDYDNYSSLRGKLLIARSKWSWRKVSICHLNLFFRLLRK